VRALFVTAHAVYMQHDRVQEDGTLKFWK